MDFIRASVKALYYDYPVNTAIQIVATGSASLMGEFTRIVNAREKRYTQACLQALQKKVCGEWMGIGIKTCGTDELIEALKLPCIYAEEALDNKTKAPTVDFDHLFRWNEMSKFVGEDLMVLNYIAKKDIQDGVIRRQLTWSNVLSHNNEALDAELRKNDKGWCDIHLHFDASTDVFGISWVSLMNNIRGKKDAFSELKYPLDSPIVVTKRYSFDDLYKWCVIAALIRFELFKCYALKIPDTFNEKFERKFFRMAILQPMFFGTDLRNLQCSLTTAGLRSLKTSDGQTFDYALCKMVVDKAMYGSPYLIYQGERYLLYQFYRDYWSKTDRVRTICKYVYLYELIKNQLRRELMLVNEVAGLGNFQDYNRRKNKIAEKELTLTAKRFAVHSTLEAPSDGMEVRVAPQLTARAYHDMLEEKYYVNIFGKGLRETKQSLEKRLTFVVHFLKQGCKNNRFGSFRKDIKNQAEVLMEDVYKVEEKRAIPHRIVGIDVAGGETLCRPEVFAHLYRYCRKAGMRNFTYHAGEDFYDITEGLRTIEEAVRLLHLRSGNRLGHCIALGIDAKKYYNQRNRKVVMPKQLLLDNIVWLFKQKERYGLGMEKQIRETLEGKLLELYGEIGYSMPFDIDSYYRSMLLRGDDMKVYDRTCSDWNVTTFDDSIEACEARTDAVAVQLCKDYFMDDKIYSRGYLQTAEFKVPYRYEILIKKLQNKMIRTIKDKGISIESNPTSNVRIGRMEKYDEHPLYRFAKVRKRPDQNVIVTVNTDDKGIFGTSMHRELSLVAFALTKQRMKGNVHRWPEGLVYQYVGCLAAAGQKNRFR